MNARSPLVFTNQPSFVYNRRKESKVLFYDIRIVPFQFSVITIQMKIGDFLTLHVKKLQAAYLIIIQIKIRKTNTF